MNGRLQDKKIQFLHGNRARTSFFDLDYEDVKKLPVTWLINNQTGILSLRYEKLNIVKLKFDANAGVASVIKLILGGKMKDVDGMKMWIPGKELGCPKQYN